MNDEKRREIPDWKCERFLLNELDDAEMAEIRRAMENDAKLRARLDAIKESNREILAEFSPERMGQQMRERLHGGDTAVSGRRRFGFARARLVPAGLLVAVFIALVAAPHLIPPDRESTGVDYGPERLKGTAPQLHLYRKTASGSERIQDGDLAAENDLIIIEYQTSEDGFGSILSVDGRGTITRHLPVNGSQAAQLTLRAPQLLDYSYELDDAPLWEVFFFVTSSRPFAVDDVIKSIAESLALARSDSSMSLPAGPPQVLGLPEELRVSKITLVKE